MAAVNDSMKKITVHAPDVININGTDVYVDKDGMVVRTEKHKDKKKLFAKANDKLMAKMPKEKNLSLEEIIAMQKQND